MLECVLITPTPLLLDLINSNKTIQASSLRMHTPKCNIADAHFVSSKLPSHVTSTLREKLKADLSSLPVIEHTANIYATVANILRNAKRLVELGRNETEVRYAICDPVVNMVCDCFKYTLRLEESVKNNVEGEIEEVNDNEEATVLQDLKTLLNQKNSRVKTQTA